jgi:uncharacterized protein (DUF58 family)
VSLAPSGAALRAGAEALADPLPPFLAEASHLAQTVVLGEHGRRRPGLGDTFWQYRPALPGDPARSIDWRRSARSDQSFVQDKEWQIAQSVVLWVDRGRSMDWSSGKSGPTKAARARVLALAAAILLVRGGERVGLTGAALPPARGQAQVARLAGVLAEEDPADYAAPSTEGYPPQSRALFLTDAMGEIAALEGALTRAADRGIRGALVQVLDPAEAAFPFDGRTIFESPGGTIRHETLMAGGLKARYLARLAERQERLALLAQATGWQVRTHLTDRPAAEALVWIVGALGRHA